MVFLVSGIFVFDEIFGVRFFKKQELCHFEQSLGNLALFFGEFVILSLLQKGKVSTCKATLYNKEKHTSYENLFFETKIQLTQLITLKFND